MKDKKRIRRKLKREDVSDLKKTKSDKKYRIGRARGGIGKTYSTSDFNKKSRKFEPKDDGSPKHSKEEIERIREMKQFKEDILNNKKIGKERHDGDDLIKELDIPDTPLPVEKK
jgi:hypothetical protein